VSINSLEAQSSIHRIVFPSDLKSRLSVEEALRRALAEIATLKSRLASESARTCDERNATDFEDIVGRTPSIQQLLARIGQVAATNSAVLVTGETGTGKELVARAVHRQSRRRNRPLVIVNCAALAPTLVESELFGHERGAFTGATSRRAGRFELADRGTVFLDEVGELPEAIQVKLLRVLQTGEVERLGSSQVLRVDARLIAATNRNLEAEVAAGRFRADLYYRLNVFPLHVPPLRERREDLPLLIAYLADKKGKAVGKIVEGIPPEVMQGLLQYHWPGNVRELENVLERAIILSRDGVLTLEGFLGQAPPGSGSQIGGPTDETTGPDNRTMRDVERAHILRVCEQCGWRIKGPGSASVRLGLKPSTLYFRMERLGIVRPGLCPERRQPRPSTCSFVGSTVRASGSSTS
jgi:transcriptional regulator with GAF, ATPase, and Fis domain